MGRLRSNAVTPTRHVTALPSSQTISQFLAAGSRSFCSERGGRTPTMTYRATDSRNAISRTSRTCTVTAHLSRYLLSNTALCRHKVRTCYIGLTEIFIRLLLEKNCRRWRIEVRPTALPRPQALNSAVCRWPRPSHAARLAALARSRWRKPTKYYSHQSILTPPPSSPPLLCYPPPLRNILNVIHKPDVHNVYITLLSEKGLATATGNMYMKFDV